MMRSKPVRTVREALVKGIVGPIFIVGGLAAGLYATSLVLEHNVVGTLTHEGNGPASRLSPSQRAWEEAFSAAMQEAGGRDNCWGNDGRTHPFPGHVFARILPRDKVGHLYGPKVTAEALDQVVKHKEGRLDVMLFCK